MGQITSLFVHKVLKQADATVDKLEVLGDLGILPEDPVDPSVMVDSEAYYDFLSRLAHADPSGTDLPLRTGASMRCDDYGAFGLAWKSAVTLRGSYERAQRYGRVLTSVATYQVESVTDGALMRLHRDGPRHLGMRFSNEATIASIVSISAQVSTQPFRPMAVYFRHSRPDGPSVHEQHFGCEVSFESEMDALLVSNSILESPNRLGDESISTFFDAHLDKALGNFTDESALESRVRLLVSKALSEGVPKISDISDQLALSPRTLQRRLGEHGSSFQRVVDSTRRRLAERLLRESSFPLTEIAFLTGFSEQSAFNRAFKRWVGQTPLAFRETA